MRQIMFSNAVKRSVLFLDGLRGQDAEELATTLAKELELNSDDDLSDMHDAHGICKTLLLAELDVLIDFADALDNFTEGSDMEDAFIKWCEDNHWDKDFTSHAKDFLDYFVGVYDNYDHAGREFLSDDAASELELRELIGYFDFAKFARDLEHSYTVYELDSGRYAWVAK